MEPFWNDLRYAVRALLKSPGFSAAAVLVLALGIGANTAIFSLVNAVLLQPLPYHDPARLVMVWESKTGPGRDILPVAPGNFFDWRARTSLFEDIGWSWDAMYNLTGDGDPESVIGYRFSPNFLAVMGVAPALGRAFAPDEDRPGKNTVVILSDKLWRRRYAADAAIVGRTITMDGTPYTVIGVMPPRFNHPADTLLWAPLVVPPALQSRRDAGMLRLVGRLKPGVTIARAQQELSDVYASMAREHPSTNQGVGVRVVGLSDKAVGDAKPALSVLLGAVGFVLLIACANVANLLLARASARQKELAIRVALGASRGRVLRQVLMESTVLGLGGGALGLVLAAWSVNGLIAMFPQTISNLPLPRLAAVPIDARVLVFTMSASIAAGLALGLLPAVHASRGDVSRWLKEGRGSSAAAGGRLQNTLVVAEIALSMVLLVGAMLMVRSFMHLESSTLGFVPDRVLSMRMILPRYKYERPDQIRALVARALERISALPGVEAAGATNFLPLSGWWGSQSFYIDGKPKPAPNDMPEADYRLATPRYFDAMGIRLLRGRSFTDADAPGAPKVATINETVARRYWPNEDPIGRRLIVDDPSSPEALEVVGVVADVKSFGVQEETHPEIFRAVAQEPSPVIGLAVRTAGDPELAVRSVQRAIWEVDKDQPVSYVMPMRSLANESLAFERVSMLLIGAFAALALALAAVGVYGVLAYLVAQRSREIGIRLALGADRLMVLRLILGRALGLAAIGGVVGLVAAFALSRVLRTLLYGVKPLDPASFAAAAVLVPLIAAIAAAAPGLRATRVDPITALREE